MGRQNVDGALDELDDVNPYASPRAPCPSAGESLPAALAAEIDRLLEPGESVVWQGRPQLSSLHFLKLVLIQTAVLAALLLATTLMAPADPLLWGVFGFMIFMAIMASSLLSILTVRSTAFALTTRRAMLCTGLPLVRGRAQTYLPEEVDWITQPKSQPASTEIVPPELPPFVVPPRHLFDAVTNRQQVCRLVCDTLLPELARRLQHGDPLIRRRSAACLAKMGPAAAGFAQSLLAALHDDDAVVRRHAIIAIGNGRVASAQSHLERLRFDDDRRVAQAAIDALDWLRPAAPAGEFGSSA